MMLTKDLCQKLGVEQFVNIIFLKKQQKIIIRLLMN